MSALKTHIKIGNRIIGFGHPVYVVAEMSANHHQSYEKAVKLLHAAKNAGADAVKLQTYTPETMTLDISNDCFTVSKGTLWEGQSLYRLYESAFTSWEWHKDLYQEAKLIGLDLFSTPFDASAVDFLETLGFPAYKIASFEIVDLNLIALVAKTGKPIIMSTGMATEAEISDAIETALNHGANEIVLLKCTSAYPAPLEEMNLNALRKMSKRFGVSVGLSDHTMGSTVAIAAVALGASLIEKHFTLSRNVSGPDSAFSMEPHEFKEMVTAIRATEKALGSDFLGATPHEQASLAFRRSLFVVRDVKKGELFSNENVRAIRPGHGLPPKYLQKILGTHAACNVRRGTPLSFELISEKLK